jgi:hypothetical protein
MIEPPPLFRIRGMQDRQHNMAEVRLVWNTRSHSARSTVSGVPEAPMATLLLDIDPAVAFDRERGHSLCRLRLRDISPKGRRLATLSTLATRSPRGGTCMEMR